MDATTKVQKYLAELRQDDTSSPRTTTLKTVRGPGQASQDPLQFVANPTGSGLAERAKQIVSLTEQQKRLREKQSPDSMPRYTEEEEWQEDLDTWRRRRRDRISSEEQPTVTREFKDYGSSKRYADDFKDSKEEILTIASPSGDDSGIENRTSNSHSPSTSLDFSPRSDQQALLSPSKSVALPSRSESPPPPTYAPPPPPEKQLDQVLINLSTGPSRVISREEEEPDYPLPPVHLRSPSRERHVKPLQSPEAILSPTTARVSATFAAIPERTHSRVEPFVANSIKEHSLKDKPVNVELTVELNREQKAQVSATKFPSRRDQYIAATEAKREVSPARASPPYRYQSTDSAYRSQEFESTRVSTQSRHISVDNKYTQKQPIYITTVSCPINQPSYSSLSHSVSTPNVASAGSGTQSHKMPPTVFRTVDIHFDDSAASYQPPKRDKDGLMHIVVEMGAYPVHKGFGFTTNSERRRCVIDSVVVGTPADRAGLLIGDRIDSINGDRISEEYPSAIARRIHEAARNGEITLAIERNHLKSHHASSPSLEVSRATATHRFDQTRNVFSDKTVDSYAEFKRRHSRAPRDSPSSRDYHSLPRSGSAGTNSYDSVPRRRDNSLSSSRSTRESSDYFGSAKSINSGGADYKVTSLHERAGPGRLADFVPEVEREQNTAASGRRSMGAEEPRTIRNYEVPPTRTSVTYSTSAVPQDEPVNAVYTRTTLPRKSTSHDEHVSDDDTVPGKSYLRKNLRHLSLSPGPPSILKRSRDIDEPVYDTVALESLRDYREYNYKLKSPTGKKYRSTESILEEKTTEYRVHEPRPDYKVHEDHYATLDSVRNREEDEYEEMYHRKQPYHTVGAYGTGTTVIPVEILRTKYYNNVDTPRPYSSTQTPRPYSRARSSDHLQTREYRERRGLDISDVTHRFYDREGKYVDRENQRGERNIEIGREYVPRRERRYDELEGGIWIGETETRDWRDVINQQRQPAPGHATDNQRIREVQSSMSNLPAIIDRKTEVARRLQKEQIDYSYSNPQKDRNDYAYSTPQKPRETYEKTQYGMYEKSYTPESYSTPSQHYSALRYSQPPQETTKYSQETTNYSDFKTSNYNQQASNYKEQAQSASYNQPSNYKEYEKESNGYKPQAPTVVPEVALTVQNHSYQGSNFKEQTSNIKENSYKEQTSNNKEEIKREPENKDQVVAVSGKHRCAHCGEELGRGAAMIVESLSLFYHLACFKCFVCKTPLGSGNTGADVRVREGRLHCQSCYSNDKVQLSKV